MVRYMQVYEKREPPEGSGGRPGLGSRDSNPNLLIQSQPSYR